MCGISGEISARGLPSVVAVAQALADLTHRGPDGLGLIQQRHIALGCARLAISGPPIAAIPAYSDGRALALNGEIYGLDPAASDTTWLLDRINQGGLAVLDRIDGMFAFCLADFRAGRLTLARDRFGIKPIFYHQDARGVAFASELAPLARARGADLAPDPDVVLQYIGLGANLGRSTLLRDVVTVAPGGRCTFSLEGARLSADCAAVRPRPAEPATLADAFEASVLACANTTQQVGLFLSGGLDSTAIAAVLSRSGIKDLHTFSLILEGDGVRDLAELGLPGTAWRTWRHCSWTPSAAATEDAFRHVLGFTSYPCFPPSAAYMFLLAQRAAQAGVRVALLGEGADELFGGYTSYMSLAADRSAASFYMDSGPMIRAAGLVDDTGAAARIRAHLEALGAGKGSTMQQLLAMELPISLVPLLARVDETTMRVGIEARVPFLHGDLPALALKAAARLPSPHDLGDTKPILREEFSPIVGGRAVTPKRPLRVSGQFWRTTGVMSEILAALEEPGPLPLRRGALADLRAETRNGSSDSAILAALRVYQMRSFTQRFSQLPQ